MQIDYNEIYSHMKFKSDFESSIICNLIEALGLADLLPEERAVMIPVSLLEELASYHPGCVGPETYGKSMYGLAQAAVALLEYAQIDEHELAAKNDTMYVYDDEGNLVPE